LRKIELENVKWENARVNKLIEWVLCVFVSLFYPVNGYGSVKDCWGTLVNPWNKGTI